MGAVSTQPFHRTSPRQQENIACAAAVPVTHAPSLTHWALSGLSCQPLRPLMTQWLSFRYPDVRTHTAPRSIHHTCAGVSIIVHCLVRAWTCPAGTITGVCRPMNSNDKLRATRTSRYLIETIIKGKRLEGTLLRPRSTLPSGRRSLGRLEVAVTPKVDYDASEISRSIEINRSDTLLFAIPACSMKGLMLASGTPYWVAMAVW